jgi:hypothetical protein
MYEVSAAIGALTVLDKYKTKIILVCSSNNRSEGGSTISIQSVILSSFRIKAEL